MITLVSDSFNRADSPTTLGNADTGQTWVPLGTGDWGIESNTAFRDVPAGPTTQGFAVIDAGTPDSISQITILNAAASNGLGLANQGLVLRWFSDQWNWYITYSTSLSILRLFETRAGLPGVIVGFGVVLADNDIISAACCGDDISVLLNGVEVMSAVALPGDITTTDGTFYGLQSEALEATFDNFLVTTNDTCGGMATWTLPPLEWSAEGTVETLPTPSTNTMRFDSGLGNEWYIVPAITDSGQELRSKNLKSVRVTGKLTNADAMQYGYDVSTPIVVTDLEDGLNSSTGAIPLDNTTVVAESQRWQTNVPNSVLSSVRVSGNDTGETERDTVHEIIIEIAEQGVRR